VRAEGDSDVDLARRAAAGDGDAFAVLHRRYRPVALRSSWRAARRTPQLDVEETANLALTRLWLALPRFDPAQPFEPWAAVVIANAVRTAVDATRTAKAALQWSALVAPRAEEGEAPRSPLDDVVGADTADQPVLLSEEAAAVRDLLREVLTDLEAGAMRLRLGGWGYDEIAARLGVSTKSVDNALRRATGKLRDAVAARAGAAGG
jgi:RNA polymerase sigma-70 factor, ECF subfamily